MLACTHQSASTHVCVQGPTGALPYHLPYRGSTRPAGQSLASLKRDLKHEAWEAVAFPERAAKRVRDWWGVPARRPTIGLHSRSACPESLLVYLQAAKWVSPEGPGRELYF